MIEVTSSNPALEMHFGSLEPAPHTRSVAVALLTNCCHLECAESVASRIAVQAKKEEVVIFGSKIALQLPSPQSLSSAIYRCGSMLEFFRGLSQLSSLFSAEFGFFFGIEVGKNLPQNHFDFPISIVGNSKGVHSGRPRRSTQGFLVEVFLASADYECQSSEVPNDGFGAPGCRVFFQARTKFIGGFSTIGDNLPEFLPGFSYRIFSSTRKVPYSPFDLLSWQLETERRLLPWRVEVITETEMRRNPKNLPVTLHIHAHSAEGIEQIGHYVHDLIAGEMGRLSNIIVTTTSRKTSAEISKVLSSAGLQKHVDYVLVKNWGRNFGAIRQLALSGYFAKATVVCHIHNKRSEHMDPKRVFSWRWDLFEGLLSPGIFDSVCEAFSASQSLGIVWPWSRSFASWGDNLSLASELCARQGVDLPLKQPDFPVGGMFFAQAEVLTRIFTHYSLAVIAAPEPILNDGEYVHALERILPLLFRAQGYRIGKTVRRYAEERFPENFV